MDEKARHHQLRQYFDQATTLTGAARSQFLATVSASDAQIGAELAALLQADAEKGQEPTQKPLQLITQSFASMDDAYWLGRTVGRYLIQSRLGIGGMGQVFLCERVEAELAQRVALKIVRQEAMSANLAKRFEDERQILASLQHPGIAHFIDAGVDVSGLPFFVMEYVDGVPFSRFCKQADLSIAQRITLFRKVVAAIAYAHRNLVIHRDLKPSNVLVTPEGEVKLLDFGIAKVLGDRHQTATAERSFTLAYAAPEQLSGRNVGIACDIYGLGALLYEALCGAPPFDVSQASGDVIEKLIRDTPPKSLTQRFSALAKTSGHHSKKHAFAKWQRTLIGDLEHIVQKALRKEPEARYRSADELDGDLQAYLEGRVVRAAAGGGMYKLQKFVARHRGACASAVIFALSLTAAFVVIVLQNIALSKARDRAESARNTAQTELARASALSAFLTDDLISRANPLVASKGQDAVLKDVLLAARARLATRFGKQPATEATIRGSLGGLFDAIDLWPQAREETQIALTLTLAESGGKSIEALRLRSRLARVLCKMSQFDDANRELTVLQRDAAARSDAETQYLLSSAWSTFYVTRGEYAKAMPKLETAVRALRAFDPENTAPRDALRIQLIFVYTAMVMH
jgi:eukaryotic-like serine/threonine-protein kinase